MRDVENVEEKGASGVVGRDWGEGNILERWAQWTNCVATVSQGNWIVRSPFHRIIQPPSSFPFHPVFSTLSFYKSQSINGLRRFRNKSKTTPPNKLRLRNSFGNNSNLHYICTLKNWVYLMFYTRNPHDELQFLFILFYFVEQEKRSR